MAPKLLAFLLLLAAPAFAQTVPVVEQVTIVQGTDTTVIVPETDITIHLAIQSVDTTAVVDTVFVTDTLLVTDTLFVVDTVFVCDTIPTPPDTTPGIVLFTEGFDDTDFVGRGWYDTGVPIISGTEQRTGNAAVEFEFEPGASNPLGRIGRHKFTPTEQFRLEYWMKYSPNWVGSGVRFHPHEFYFLTTDDPDYAGPYGATLEVLVETTHKGDGNGMAMNFILGPDIYSSRPHPAPREVESAVVMSDNPGPNYKGDWHKVEFFVRMNSGVGIPDGIAQVSFDGTLVIDLDDLLYRARAGEGDKLFNQMLLTPYIGPGSPVGQTVWYDDLVLSTGEVVTPPDTVVPPPDTIVPPPDTLPPPVGALWSTSFANCSSTGTTWRCDGARDTGTPTPNGSDDLVTIDANRPGSPGMGFRHWQADGENRHGGGAVVGLGGSHPELWVRWWMRYEAGFSWQGGQPFYDKWMFIDSGNSRALPEFSAGNSRISTIGADGGDQTTSWGWPEVMGGSQGDGQWHCYEVHIRTDGIGQMWIDDVLRLDSDNINYGALSSGWTRIQFGANNRIPANGRDMYQDWDDMVVYTTTPPNGVNIGCGN
jgi:hypothetical protein